MRIVMMPVLKVLGRLDWCPWRDDRLMEPDTPIPFRPPSAVATAAALAVALDADDFVAVGSLLDDDVVYRIGDDEHRGPAAVVEVTARAPSWPAGSSTSSSSPTRSSGSSPSAPCGSISPTVVALARAPQTGGGAGRR